MSCETFTVSQLKYDYDKHCSTILTAEDTDNVIALIWPAIPITNQLIIVNASTETSELSILASMY